MDPQLKSRLGEHPELARGGGHGGIGKPSFHLGNPMMVEAMETAGPGDWGGGSQGLDRGGIKVLGVEMHPKSSGRG